MSSTLDLPTRTRLATLRAATPDCFASSEHQTGEDATGTLALTIDPTRHVVGVTTARLDDALRTPKGLRTAVSHAWHQAETQRLEASIEAVGGLDALGRSPSTLTLDELMDRGPSRRVIGTSGNGCVSVELPPCAIFGDVDADPGWLRQARDHNVTRAVLAAFLDAYRLRGSDD